MKYIFLLLFSLAPTLFYAQSGSNKKDNTPSNAWLIFAGFSFDQKAEDLSNRFGYSNSASLSVEHFWGKNKVFGGITGHYGFGTEVKEDVLMNLRTPQGDIIGSNNSLASVFLRERYWYTGLYAGKLFGFIGKKKQSGLRLALGAGIWQHWIRIQDDTNNAAQVAGDYEKGYDRMTNGPAAYGSIGYQHFSNNGLVNFHVSFEVTKGWLTHQRAWNFTDNIPGGEKRNDMMYGVRVAWALPFFYGGKEEVIFY